MSLRTRVDPGPWGADHDRDAVVRLGRGPENDVRVGHQRVGGRWTVSRVHAELRWDGTRWSTLNLSTRPGLLVVYEPGWEEVPIEPGRPWVPVRHRWCYGIGRPGQRVHVVCETDDHRGPGGVGPPEATGPDGDDDGAGDDLTTDLVGPPPLSLTPLEREVVLAYYSDFALLPRPATLAPRPHDQAARRLGRSRDSTRKAIERVNRKVAAVEGAPEVAEGRNVSAEVGRWLARWGALDPR
ncbi:FHA domain-containing protein [Iamia majanohamensis]|uniref:FHA domain-containing protein n=1 Tax=Iamia majanohamensis TaxID=467976 RepID=A0AAE9YF56_9ACTN|nr:FHA domain-containing protein [Iamia majanohamensis]WCO66701.1 FHA domain-containing protein [Iamia majanohamensis]